MATQTKSDPIETATEKVAEFNDKAAENGRKASAAYLDSYEKAVVQFADGYEKAATATKIEWLSDRRCHAGRLRPRGHQGVHERRARPRRPLSTFAARSLLLRRYLSRGAHKGTAAQCFLATNAS